MTPIQQAYPKIELASRGLEALLWVSGIILFFYIVAGIFDLVTHSSVYFVNFAIGVVFMSGLLGLIGITERFTGNVRVIGDEDAIDRSSLPTPNKLFSSIEAAVILIATIAGLVGLIYFKINVQHLVVTAPFFSQTDILMGYPIIFSMIVLTWIHWGRILGVIVALAVAYFFFGQYIPVSILQHRAYNLGFIMNYLALNTNAGFFKFSFLASDQIYLLIYFGTTMLGVGMLRMLIEVGKAAGRRFRGGAAMPAVLGSSAVGAVMGQAVSNVVITGRMTIPMMKKYNYEPQMAGAIEATSSAVGQIMPPVLGLAAFLIASFLGMSYVTVALNALIPALLYVFGTAISIAVYAYRHDLPRLTDSVNTTLIWRMFPTLVIPLGLVVWLLLHFYSPSYAGFIGMITAIGLAMMIQGPYRPSMKDLLYAFREGMYLATILALLILAIGPLGQAMITTNLSGRLAVLLALFLPHVKILLLIGAMILCLILGMGLPTPIAYIVAALCMVGFLVQTGIDVYEANFFVFYFAVFSTLTPPVAVSVLAASKIAKSTFVQTGINAVKIAGTTFIIPYAFVYNPVLLSFPDIGFNVVVPLIEVMFGQIAFAIFAFGYCFKKLAAWERAMFFILAMFAYWVLITHGSSFMIRDIVLFLALPVLTSLYWIRAKAAGFSEKHGNVS